jgi:predicted dehydrogenase
MALNRLGVGFVGSGFNARFHIRSWLGVRDADVRGVWSPNHDRAKQAAELASSLRVGDARAFSSIEDMVAAPDIDCIWLCGPNHTRLECMERVVGAIESGKGKLIGIACEKPLARNVREARRMVELVERAGLLHGYLENQVFTPNVQRGREIVWARGAALTGRPYLARAAEEHSGPHKPWFWQGELQGGGVLSDMMCHSVECARYLLTKPGEPRGSIRPVRVSAQIASLKWSRPEYASLLQQMMGKEIDYRSKPSEDFAHATFDFVDASGLPLIVEATTSWSYIGAGLRLSMELLGPEYSMSINTLESALKIFFSRSVRGEASEDLVEKQNAEQGLMPVVASEAIEYGYEAENRYFVQCFIDGKQPEESFHDGLEVTELLMTAYMSAEQQRVVEFRPADLDAFVPAVARGAWKG